MYMTITISDNINNMYYNNCDLTWNNHTCCAKNFQTSSCIYICICYMVILCMIDTIHGIRDDHSLKYMDSKVGKHPVYMKCLVKHFSAIFNVALKSLSK